jgi:Transposase DDE domain
MVRMRFQAATCRACPVRQACAWPISALRQLSVRPQVRHEAIQAARHRQETAELTASYAARAGVEGTQAQGIRRCGLRPPRDVGLAKTHLQHVSTAMALNVARLGARWLGTPPAKNALLALRHSARSRCLR